MNYKKYLKTTEMAMQEKTNGGLVYLLPNIFLQLCYLIPLLFLWRTLIKEGMNVGMGLPQMLSYTYVSILLSDMLVVKTVASSWLYEGVILSLYERPIPIWGHLIAQTIGGWLPMLLCFSIPMALVAPFFGIVILPSSAWFFVSLLLCISLGFAIDFLFACLTMRLRGMSWLVYVIRMAVVSLFSGTVIPFILMPFGLDKLLKLQPFGSLGGATLSIFTGASEPIGIIALQLFGNILLWPLAIILFKKSQEEMISYGG
jgi:ABC-2 type transport system permease protein